MDEYYNIPMNEPRMRELIFFFVLLFIVSYLAFAIIWPYLTPLFLAVVLAVLFAPIYRRLLRWFRGRKAVASLLTVTVVLLVILIPVIFLGILMFQEAVNLYTFLATTKGDTMMVTQVTTSIESAFRNFMPALAIKINILSYVETGLTWMEEHFGILLSSIVGFAFNIILVVVTMFFLYRDKEHLHAFVLKWSSLSDEHNENILTKLNVAILSILEGTLATAVAQGLLVGIGFAIFGVQNPVLWGGVATIAALIPIVEANIIAIPGAAILFLSGHHSAGIGLALWSFFSIGLIDNFFRPALFERGMHVHPLLVFLSVLGGLVYFGPIGFIAGPIVMVFFFTLLDIYPTLMKRKFDHQEKTSQTH